MLLLLLFLLGYSPAFPAPVGRASASLVIPATLAAGILFKEWAGALYGFTVGIAMDTACADSFCFNTLALFLLCCASGLLITRVFINNGVSTSIILVADILVYFVAKWLFLRVFTGAPDCIAYLFKITLPSAALTALLGLPLFFAIRAVARRLVR